MKTPTSSAFPLSALVALIGTMAAAAGVSGETAPPDRGLPHLRKQGSATQLVVDGKPILILGAELHNSSASSLEYMKPLWPRLVATRLNTVLATVSWELVEPEEGRFDFRLVDGLIQEARTNDVHLVLLWFASWKNGTSNYQPLWVKTNQERFPLAMDEQGRSMPILSTFGEANRDADARAFAALMRHLREVDGQKHTVLMVQVQNEVGVLGDSRDYSPPANRAFAGPVPKLLMHHLVRQRDSLVAELRELWAANGSRTAGTWTEVFGPGKPVGQAIPVRTLSPPLTAEEHENGWRKLHWPADEIFMAWHYARYVNHVARAGKAEYDIPMFVNAWLQQRDHAWPGTYPSGGPVPQVIDVWQAGAPAIDLLAPDIYLPEFEELCARFTRSGNPLFIPEARGDTRGVANAILAFGRYDAIGFSPFGIDRFAGADTELARGYEVVSQVAPLVLEHQGKGTMTALLLDRDGPAQHVRLGRYDIEARFSTRSFGPATDTPPERVAGLFISTGPDELVVSIEGRWTVRFVRGGPELPEEVTTSALGSWTRFGAEATRAFSGTATYTITFPRPAAAATAWRLDLGRVTDSARVRLNGEDLGTVIGPGDQLTVTGTLLAEHNVLEIDVTNQMANRIADLDRRHVPWKKFYNVNFPARLRENRGPDGLFSAARWEPLESGLLGPVILQPVRIGVPADATSRP